MDTDTPERRASVAVMRDLAETAELLADELEAGSDPLTVLEEADATLGGLRSSAVLSVGRLARAEGATYRAIGERLGVSQQAAHQRFGQEVVR